MLCISLFSRKKMIRTGLSYWISNSHEDINTDCLIKAENPYIQYIARQALDIAFYGDHRKVVMQSSFSDKVYHFF